MDDLVASEAEVAEALSSAATQTTQLGSAAR